VGTEHSEKKCTEGTLWSSEEDRSSEEFCEALPGGH
jgi:hypothetical protein